MADMIVITLNDPQFMGGDAFGYDRIIRVLDGMQQNYDIYFDALTRSTEADYYRSKLDEALQRIIKDREKFHKFEERYPYLPEIRYTK